jgi:hypothetical protein
MKRLEARIVASLRRAPYVWLALIVVVLIQLGASLKLLESHHPKEWIGWIAAGYSVYSIGMTIWLRRRQRGVSALSDDRSLALRWCIAIAPYMVGWSAVAFGSYPWPVGLGFVVTVGLLIAAARASRAANLSGVGDPRTLD